MGPCCSIHDFTALCVTLLRSTWGSVLLLANMATVVMAGSQQNVHIDMLTALTTPTVYSDWMGLLILVYH